MLFRNYHIKDLLSRLKLSFTKNDPAKYFAGGLPPLRSEIFDSKQFEQHGRSLALLHKTETGKTSELLVKRLKENEKILIEVRNLLTNSKNENHEVVLSGERILNNFYLIEENIDISKGHLYRDRRKNLPYLMNTGSAGLPRVYDIAVEIISHSDGRLDLGCFNSFVSTYKNKAYLKKNELWWLPDMLRLTLIENLRRISETIAINLTQQDLADYWSKTMMDTVQKDPKNLILDIADMARSNPPMEGLFVVEFMQKLRRIGATLSLPLNWMEQRLVEIGFTSRELVDLVNQKLQADQVSSANSLESLRFLRLVEWQEFKEWQEFVEKMNALWQTFQPNVYLRMDFSTPYNGVPTTNVTGKY